MRKKVLLVLTSVTNFGGVVFFDQANTPPATATAAIAASQYALPDRLLPPGFWGYVCGLFKTGQGPYTPFALQLQLTKVAAIPCGFRAFARLTPQFTAPCNG